MPSGKKWNLMEHSSSWSMLTMLVHWAKNVNTTENETKCLLEANSEVVQEVNTEKSELMFMFYQRNA
jgi:hypothetical protein